jgi:hypothetical protein
VVWIEETQRKTMVCGVKEGSDRHHVSFSSPLTPPKSCHEALASSKSYF